MASNRELKKEVIEDIAPAIAASLGPEAAITEEVLERKLRHEHNKTDREIEELKRRLREEHERRIEAERRNGASRRNDEASSLRQSLSNMAKNIGTSRGGGNESGGAGPHTLVFIMTLGWHVFDAMSGFTVSNPSIWVIRILIYALAGLLMWMYASSQGYDPRTAAYTSVIAMAAPLVLHGLGALLPGSVGGTGGAMEAISFFFLFTPIWPLAISYYYGKKRLAIIWFVFVVFVPTIFLILDQLILGPFFPSLSENVNPLNAGQQFFEVLMDAGDSIWNSIQRGILGIETGIERSINYATGGYYTSVVEQQQDEPVGLYIENLRASSEVFFTGEPVYLWADIGGKSFRRVLEVATSCGIEDTNIEGETEPTQFEVFYQGGEAVQCRFNNLSVPEGEDEERYRVEFRASFDYETWGYVTYTFVDQETKRNMLSQGIDINKEFDVPSSLRPIYTPGPIALDMLANIPQPVGVSSQNGVNTAFGIRLTQMWTEGELERVDEVIVLIPPEFELASCDAPIAEVGKDPLCGTNPDQCASELKAYSFPNRGAKRFDSVGCRLHLAEGNDIGDVLPPGQQKVQKTFVVRAKYDYLLTEDERIEVRDVGE